VGIAPDEERAEDDERQREPGSAAPEVGGVPARESGRHRCGGDDPQERVQAERCLSQQRIGEEAKQRSRPDDREPEPRGAAHRK
jgi:hypothetical protein